jgi:hypothetical protein
MTAKASPPSVSSPHESVVDAVFDLEPAVSLRCIDSILAHGPTCQGLSPQQAIYLLWSRAALVGDVPLHERAPRVAPHPLPANLARDGIREFLRRGKGGSAYAAPVAADRLSEDLLKELQDAAWSPGSAAGTVVSGIQLLDALVHSLPPSLHVRLQGGTWELYDANKTPRKHAFGNRGKAKFPVRMQLRARGARMPWLTTFRSTPKGMVIPVPDAKALPPALKLAGAQQMKWVNDAAWKKLPLRGVLGSSAVGAAISFGPQLYFDAQDAHLFKDATSKAAWEDFALRTAKSLPTNVAGLVGGLVLGAAVVAIGAASAPAIIIVTFGGGVLGAALFNLFGLDDKTQEAARWLLGK